MERIINEFRVIETDDGFRIEIKGDKAKIASFMSCFGKHGHRAHWHGHRCGSHFGPWMWMKAASCCEGEEPDTDES